MLRIRIPKQRLIELYVHKRWSAKKIGKYFRCSRKAIFRRLNLFNVKIRQRGSPQKRTDITKDFLFKEYVENHKSMGEIAKQMKCSESIVNNYIHRFEIKPRSKSEALKGRVMSDEWKRNIGIAARNRGLFGEKASNWKGGISFDKTAIRRNFRYQSFRRSVLSVRGKNCEKCGKDLRAACPTCNHIPDRHVHHIKPFSKYEEERFSETNVLVLCDSCHKSQHFEKQL